MRRGPAELDRFSVLLSDISTQQCPMIGANHAPGIRLRRICCRAGAGPAQARDQTTALAVSDFQAGAM